MGRRNAPDAAAYGLPERVTCPFCDRDDTELHSPFGPQLSVATYWCHRCHTAFDYVKWAPRSGIPPRTATD
jgi:hypothetical protein